jgi:hypothetical protein
VGPAFLGIVLSASAADVRVSGPPGTSARAYSLKRVTVLA